MTVTYVSRIVCIALMEVGAIGWCLFECKKCRDEKKKINELNELMQKCEKALNSN